MSATFAKPLWLDRGRAMTTKEKPATDANREAGYDTAFDSRNHTPFASRLKALPIGIAAYDAAILALLLLFLWGALR